VNRAGVKAGGIAKRMGRVGLVLALAYVLCGCSPPADNSRVDTAGTPVDSAGRAWQTLAAAATTDMADGSFSVKIYVHVKHALSSADLTVNGDVTADGKAAFTIRAGRESYSLYQQGTRAYYRYGDAWVKLDKPMDLGWFSDYLSLFERARADRTGLTRLPEKFVGGQFCDVYQAVLPNTADVASTALMASLSHTERSPNCTGSSITTRLVRASSASTDGNGSRENNVLYTFAVGRDDHALHQVTTTAVVGTDAGGTLTTVTTDVIFFNLKAVQQVSVPQGLPTSATS
jgi:hypothetical protein